MTPSLCRETRDDATTDRRSNRPQPDVPRYPSRARRSRRRSGAPATPDRCSLRRHCSTDCNRRGGKRIERTRPALRQVESLFHLADACPGLVQVVSGRRQPGHGAVEGGALLVHVVQRVTQELAEGQRVEQRRLILRRRGRRGPLSGVGLRIEAIGQIDLIGGRAVVTGAASGDGQPQGQGLQLVADRTPAARAP